MDSARRSDFYRQMVRIRRYEAAIRAADHADKAPTWGIGVAEETVVAEGDRIALAD